MMFSQDTLTSAMGIPQWKMWMARLFGDKIVTVDEYNGRRVTMTSYQWRGVLYITKYSDALLMPDKSL